MAKGGVGVLAVVMVPVLAVAVLLWVLFFGGSAAAACLTGGGPVNIAAIPADAKVGAYGHDQLVNAALIINAGAAKSLGADGQTLGLQTAMGESSLVNIDFGDWETNGVRNPDGSPTTSIGLFQQQDSWGTPEQRMDPTTSAGLFYDRLVKVEGWQVMEPSIAINKVQRNSDPNHYTKYRADAVAIMAYLAGLGSAPAATTGAAVPASMSTATPPPAAAGCADISGDSQALAQGLVKAMDGGRLTFLEDRYAQQVRGVAAGTASADCGIDLRILQIMTVALNTFDKVGVSDINRKCTGETGYGAGTASSHYIDGGGHAVDFYSFNGTATTGCDANALKLLSVLDPQVPNGTRAGQIQCRSVTYVNISGFYDPATHLHIDMGFTDAPLTTTG